MRLGVVSQWYTPEEVALPSSLALAAVRCGDAVTVLTAFPSYPHGRLYDGYVQKSKFVENLNGVTVHRVKSFLSHDSNAVNRIRSFISFSISSTRSAKILAQNDVNYVYATPPTAAYAAWWARVRYGVPYVLHIQDLWPESATNSGMMGRGNAVKIFDLVITLMLRPIYSRASKIIVIAPRMSDALVSRGIPAEKISTVLNWDEGADARASLVHRGDGEPLRIVYAGNIGTMQDLETIARAAALLRDCRNVQFHVYGSGVAEGPFIKLVQDLGLSNLKYRGRVSKAAMKSIYASADFQLVTLKDRPLFRMTIPSKFQTAVANGIPVITTVQGDLSDICAAEGLGFSALPEDPESLADAVRAAASLSTEARRQMGERCRAFYDRHLTAIKGTAAIRKILREAAEASSASRDGVGQLAVIDDSDPRHEK